MGSNQNRTCSSSHKSTICNFHIFFVFFTLCFPWSLVISKKWFCFPGVGLNLYYWNIWNQKTNWVSLFGTQGWVAGLLLLVLTLISISSRNVYIFVYVFNIECLSLLDCDKGTGFPTIGSLIQSHFISFDKCVLYPQADQSWFSKLCVYNLC